MSKDGTNRGGARPGAGRKPKAISEKLASRNPGGRKLTVVDFGAEAESLTGSIMPPVKDYLKAKQKDGSVTCAEAIYTETWQWLQERKCDQLVTTQQIEQYAMSVARWIQCEEAVSEFGFLAKKPSGTVISSPYVTMGREYMKQANAAWFQIYQIVKENCVAEFSGRTPQDDAMERLLRARMGQKHYLFLEVFIMSNVRSADEAIRRLEEMEAQWSGKKADPSAEAKKQATAYNAAFWESMHTGMPQNSLKAGSDGAGGYLVPDTYEETLVQALAEKNVFRQIAKNIPTTHRMHIPVASGAGCADWFREDEGLSFAEESFGEVILDAYKLSASILATDEMLEDSAIDLEEHIRVFFAERIGEAEEEAFVRGNGKGKPLGLIYQAPMGAISELEGDITLDDILNLEYSIKQAYRDNAVWLMSEDAYHKLRRIPHYDGRPLWNPNLKEGEPEYLFGHRIYICKSMDDVSPGSIPVMFGNFRFFWIGDRGKRVIKRLVERYADRGQVAFITTERVDAKLVMPDAVKYLKINGKAQAAAEE